MYYIKHLIECKCILPQFKDRKPTVYHKFVVFSTFDNNGDIVSSLAQCPNCNVVHKVIEVGQSKILRKEEANSILTVDEIKTSLPENLTKLISQYQLDLPTWQEIQFIYENKLWGQHPIILSKEEVEGTTTGKYLSILGETLFQIKPFSRNEFVEDE